MLLAWECKQALVLCVGLKGDCFTSFTSRIREKNAQTLIVEFILRAFTLTNRDMTHLMHTEFTEHYFTPGLAYLCYSIRITRLFSIARI